jgi:hypothetical protein
MDLLLRPGCGGFLGLYPVFLMGAAASPQSCLQSSFVQDEQL